jgi:ABC-type bacteriocin/lantibiotic exporter with double-glycine peptidase domain
MIKDLTLMLFLRANRRPLAEMLLSSALVSLFALALPLFSAFIYDKAIGNAVHDSLWAMTLGMLLMLCMEGLLRVSRVMLLEHAGARWDIHLDSRVLNAVLAAPVSKSISFGDVLARYRDVMASRDFLSAQYLIPVADLPFLILYLAVGVGVGGWLMLIPLVIGAFVLALGALTHRVSMARHRTATLAHAQKMGMLVDTLLTREVLTASPTSADLRKRYQDAASIGARASGRARLWVQTNQQATMLALTLSNLLVLVGGVYAIESQLMSVGGLIAVNMLSSRVLSTLCGLAPVALRWEEFSKALKELDGILQISGSTHKQGLVQQRGDALLAEGFRLSHVHAGYGQTGPEHKPERQAIQDLSMSVQGIGMLVIVGNSGSGKSTLLRLLSGRIALSQGELSAGGHLLADDESRRWLASRLAFKPQEPTFLGGSLADILRDGDASLSDERLLLALRRAGLGPALERNEVGLNMKLGVNGTGLSGGQRQMVALARVFASQADILVLDEPTLGLDATAQSVVLDTLVQLKHQKRLIVSTHAAEVLQAADRVLVMEQGRLVADAPPEQLLGKRAPSQA